MLDKQTRTTQDVFDDHLALAHDGNVGEDLSRNYSPDCVIFTAQGIFRGYDDVKDLARILKKELPGASFTYTTRQAVGEVAFLEWTAQADGAAVYDGADSFVVRDGRIVAQTIHYTVSITGPSRGAG
jgi:hypothetical protein